MSNGSGPVRVRRGFVPGSGPRVQINVGYEAGTLFEDIARRNADIAMATQVAQVLHQHYRGHYWSVSVDSKQGVCLIWIPTLMRHWKYVINLSRDELTPAAVIKAGGEVLERHNLPRGALNVDRYQEARAVADASSQKAAPGESSPSIQSPPLVPETLH